MEEERERERGRDKGRERGMKSLHPHHFSLFLLPPKPTHSRLIARARAENTDFWKCFRPNYVLCVGFAVNDTNCSRGH